MRTVKRPLLIVASALALVYTSTLNAQTKPKEIERVVVQPKSTSPFELAQLIKQSKVERNGEIREVDLSELWRRLRVTGEGFDTCSGDCQLKLFREELDNRPGQEVVLELTRSWNVYRCLVYTRANSKSRRWKLLGFYDHDFNRYWMAEHRVVHALGKNWLVIRGQEGSGSGYHLGGDTWFEVSERGVEPVLHYSADGHTDPGIAGLDWGLKSSAVGLPTYPGKKPTLKLSFTVTYNAESFEDDSFKRRFVNRRFAYYVWNQRTHEFDFDPRRSSISEHEMNLIANVETDEAPEGEQIGGSTFFSSAKGFAGSGFEMFVRLNATRLMKIARGNNAPSKQWLAKFLEQCDNIPQKLAIKKALNQ